ncbi:MAG: carboxypeptidase regulatory-like domain-containing protein [Planctomycetota bacterium]|jgi:hypothetical protein
MDRKHLLGLVITLVGLAVGAGLWMMSGDDGNAGPMNVLSPSEARETGATLPSTGDAVPEPVRAPAPVALTGAVDDIDAREMPESYRRALGGLTGRVLEHDLTPVVGMTIELAGGRASTFMHSARSLLDPEGPGLDIIAASAVTGADGRFRMADIDPRTFGVLLVDPGGPRSMLQVLEMTPVSGEETDLGDIVLPLTSTLFGLVIDETNLPVANARVRATEFPYLAVVPEIADFREGCGVLISKEETDLDRDIVFRPPANLAVLERRIPVPTTYTDAEGRFELPGVHPGLVSLVVDEPAHQSRVMTGVATGAGGERRDVGKVYIQNGVKLSVTVEDKDGEPVLDSLAMAGNAMGVAPAAIMREPVSRAEDGTFLFEGLKPGQAYVAARHADRDEYEVIEIPDTSVGRVTITLTSPAELTVTVADVEGEPLSGVRFFGRLTEEDEIPEFLLTLRPLANRTEEVEPGVYKITELQPGEWDMVAELPGYALYRFDENLDKGDREQSVVLEKGKELLVRVVRKADGEPVDYARVDAMPPGGGFPRPLAVARTDESGLARLTDLGTEDITLLVTHPALAVTQMDVEMPAEGPFEGEVLVELEAGGRIVGEVTDNGFAPAEPMLVVLEPRGAEGDGELPRATVTQLDGSFVFQRVDPGRVNLEVRSRSDIGSAPSLIDAFFDSPLAKDTVEVPVDGEVSVTLDMGQAFRDMDTGYVSGQLIVNGRPAEGWKVRTFDKIRRSDSTDAAGAFNLGRIAAGDVTLMISSPGTGMEFSATDTHELTLAKDAHEVVRISFSTGAISGRVVSDLDGRPLAGVIVYTQDAREDKSWGRQTGAPTMADGSFVIDPVVAGTYRVSVRADGYANASSDVFELAELQRKDGVVIRVRPALVVSGTVTVIGLDDDPQWMWMVARSADGTSRDSSSVNKETGRFTFDRLSPGEWTFSLATNPDREFEPITIDIERDEENLELEFVALPPEEEGDGSGVFIYENY